MKFSFFKRRETPIQFISLSEAEILVTKKLKEQVFEKKHLQKELETIVSSFQKKIQKKIALLQTITLDKRREDERLKRLTIQGLEDYLFELNTFSSKLFKVLICIPEVFEEIDILVTGFFQRSQNKYERATILIGKELADTKKSITSFYKEIHFYAKAHERFLNSLLYGELLTSVTAQLENNTSLLTQSNTLLRSLEHSIHTFEKERSEKKKLLEEYLNSPHHTSYIAKRKALEKEKENLKKELLHLQKQCNLRELHKQFHGCTSEERLISAYRSSFSKALSDDVSLEIVSLLPEALREEMNTRLSLLQKNQLRLRKESEEYKEDERLETLKKKSDEICDVLDTTKKELEKERHRHQSLLLKEKNLLKKRKECIETIIFPVKIE